MALLVHQAKAVLQVQLVLTELQVKMAHQELQEFQELQVLMVQMVLLV